MRWKQIDPGSMWSRETVPLLRRQQSETPWKNRAQGQHLKDSENPVPREVTNSGF